MKITSVFILLVACCGLEKAPKLLAQEDMTGINGANRRVAVSGGYGGVTGNFTEPSSFSIGTNAQWTLHRNKPEMYMGATFDYEGKTAVESDAGVTWSQVTETDSVTGEVYPAQRWWAFTRVSAGGSNSGYVPLRLPSGSQWRVKKGDLQTFGMTVAVQPDGNLKLTVEAGGVTISRTASVTWPMRNGKIRNDVIAGMKAKRVVAMTQQAGLFYDDIYVRGVGFTGGKVAPISISATDGTLTLGTYVDWSTAPDKNDAFIPWEKNADDAAGATGVWVVDLESPHDRDDTTGVPKDRANLYDSETVNINLLRKPGSIAGKKTGVGN